MIFFSQTARVAAVGKILHLTSVDCSIEEALDVEQHRGIYIVVIPPLSNIFICFLFSKTNVYVSIIFLCESNWKSIGLHLFKQRDLSRSRQTEMEIISNYNYLYLSFWKGMSPGSLIPQNASSQIAVWYFLFSDLGMLSNLSRSSIRNWHPLHQLLFVYAVRS